MPLQQRRQLVELPPAERPLVLPHHDRVEPTIRIPDRRQQPGRLRPVAPPTPPRRPSSKNEATTVPRPSTNNVDISNCRNRDDALSWYSDVDIRP
ncbi:hypothetical protein [Saccharothrix sp. HUAS TT1]|uniref:hypothetical protein n=1 Tax=unclassified Saccharothrix TaxID=2593673 RepID=UPI00345B5081